MNAFTRSILAALVFVFAVSAHAKETSQLLKMCDSKETAQAAAEEVLKEAGLSSSVETDVKGLGSLTAEDMKNASDEDLTQLRAKINGIGQVLQILKTGVNNSVTLTKKVYGKNEIIDIVGSTFSMTFEYSQVGIEAIDMMLKYAVLKQEVPASEALALQNKAQAAVQKVTALTADAAQINTMMSQMTEAKHKKTNEAIDYLSSHALIESCKVAVKTIRK